MTAIVFVAVYAGVAVFLLACVARAVSYARLPKHLRWELYPVPHEDPERVEHGGSYFEEPQWWTKPVRFDWLMELRFMIAEMILLKGLWEHNRKLWFRSFPFHFGLYLLLLSVLCLIPAALMSPPSAAPTGLAALLASVTAGSAALGALLAMVGAFGLLLRRLRDPGLRNYTAPGDIFNLLFFLVAFGVMTVGFATKPAGAPSVLDMARAVLTFDTSIQIPSLIGAGVILCALLIAYIPMTHMAHFIGKYFTYHQIRWDDVPLIRAQQLAKEIARYLSYRPHWAAPHVMANGRRSWAEIVMINPTQGGEK